jgi:hypothetical protein
MTVLLMAAAASALVLISVTETKIAGYFDAGLRTFYAAEAALERALVDLDALAEWDHALSGASVSTFTDGPPRGVRASGGALVDLDEATSLLQCGRRTACAEMDVAAVTVERPWGRNNPRWQPYLWGPFERLGGDGVGVYLIVWIADDPGETDADPQRDGTDSSSPGRGIVTLTAHAYGYGGVRRAIEATVARGAAAADPAAPARVISWREVR